MTNNIECVRCSGTGELICNRCGGTGSLPGFATWGGGFTSCDVCYGSGYTICTECNGDGYIEEDIDDNGVWLGGSINSSLPIKDEHSVMHPNIGRTYIINNKAYLLKNQGFIRDHNGNVYRFSYEKSMELIKNKEAVLMDDTYKRYSKSPLTLHNNRTRESKTEEQTEVKEESVEALIDHSYIVNNKKYILTSQGFRREHNGNIYRFSYEKSIELINAGQAVSQTDTVKEHPVVHSSADKQSDDLVSIDINSEIIEKITYNYHNKMVTTYNKNGKKFYHWGVPYDLFLDYINSENHYHFRRDTLKAYEAKPSSCFRIDEFMYLDDEVFSAEDKEWLSENGIYPILRSGLTFVTYSDVYHDNGNRLKIKNFYDFKLLNPFTCKIYTYSSPEFEGEEEYVLHISPSLSTLQIRALCEIFEDKEEWAIGELFNL